MSKKSTEASKASSRPDDLIKPKTKGGKTELTELSEEEVGKVTGGVFYKYSGYNTISRNPSGQNVQPGCK